MGATELNDQPVKTFLKDSQPEIVMPASVDAQHCIVLHIEDRGAMHTLGPKDVIIDEVDAQKYPGEHVILRVMDIGEPGQARYRVWGMLEFAGVCTEWQRTEDDGGVFCRLPVPSVHGIDNSAKFTIGAHPVAGDVPTPQALDPIAIIRKGGQDIPE
ncbi:MAG: hypothetical protein MJE77_29255 [Proteobacteria bacterium]|nr:hypothetical protein [Pseudomonadota bacterium]